MGYCFCYVYINKNVLFKFIVVFIVLNIQKSISLNDLDERILNSNLISIFFIVFVDEKRMFLIISQISRM